jgi:uncharacterized RDD family membrane protein YckC
MAERVAASRIVASASEIEAEDSERRAGIGPRFFSFFVDSIFLFAFTMAFATVAMLDILLHTDSGRTTLSDSTAWVSVAIVVMTAPAWLLVNLVLFNRRGQTVGQYVAGLRVVREHGARPRGGQSLIYLLALHPLLFHPLLALSWGTLAFIAVSFFHSDTLLIGAIVVVVLSVVAPIVAIVSISLDGGRRAMHDRIAGLAVVRIE